MDSSREPDVTLLLKEWHEGDHEAMDRLMPIVYQELRRLAHRHLRGERPGHTLGTTALVHEAFLNLINQVPGGLSNREHFFAIASRVMRRVLIWYARKRTAAKRGGGVEAVPLDDELALPEKDVDMLISLDDALADLERVDPRLCRVVECRYFGGLSIPETASALDISPATVKRDWQTARAWLKSRLEFEIA